MPAAIKMQEELGDDVTVLFVESQDTSPADTEKFVYGKKTWMNDRSIWTNEQPFNTGAKGLPNYALLSNDGELISMGDPRSDHSKVMELIEEQIKLAKKGAKGMAPTCVKASGEFEKGNFAAAIKSLESAPDAEKADAEKLKHSLETRVSAKIARLSWYADNAMFDKADKLVAVLQKGVAGNDKLLADVKTVADQLSAKEMAQEREAAKALATVEKTITGGGIDAAVAKKLKSVSAKFPNTRAAKRADHLAELSSG